MKAPHASPCDGDVRESRGATSRKSALAFLSVLLLAAAGAHAQFTIGLNFTGTDKANEPALSGGTFNFPPDTMGAVGGSHIAELINGAYAVYNKANGALISRTSLNTFWNTAFANSASGLTTTNSFDPRILYDPFTSRWYAVSVDGGQSALSRILVAVTTGSDPTAPGAWQGFAIDPDTANTRWADFPTVGIDANGLYISNNMFDAPGGAAETTTVTVVGIPKASLTAVVPGIGGFQVRENIAPSQTGFTLQPAVDMDNSGLPLPGLSAFNTATGTLKRTDIPSNFFTGGLVGSGSGFISVTAAGAPPTADQAGAKPNLDTGDSRFSGNVVLQNGSIWSVQTIVNPGDAARSSVRWFQIRESDSVVLQSGTISDPTLSLFFPSIAVNNAGDVVIGFSGSSSATFASAYAVVGKTTAGTTTFNPIALLKAGVDDYQQLDGSARNRWGDYSVTVVDPVNDNVFWTIQEYAAADRNFDGTGTLADNNWAVQITQITIPEPATMLLTVSGFAVLGCRRLPRDRRK